MDCITPVGVAFIAGCVVVGMIVLALCNTDWLPEEPKMSDNEKIAVIGITLASLASLALYMLVVAGYFQ